ncbi:hypothetical protein [Halopiger xanaduensis]|uniref:Uncharacterized protein n=1 Tax=Halopiger xanaduensis (strain DSM 18323 / JCM 14033 / SH-6) TaxID=797210 RepID=F8D8T8_HALXS|nr:hypothetical protein [Halopiger xanaduensis]AEH37998.1 hypothetical protein Halxa_3386 [Halopiger xanaduensis SH-6]
MQPRTVDPTDARVLERNYDYAQRNVRLLSMWYECDLERMVELLAENDISLSANDERLFGSYYRSVKRRSGSSA